MATKKSTVPRASEAKPAAAPAPTLLIGNSAPPAPLPDHFDVLNALIDIKGAVKLCQQIAGDDANGGELISAIEGTLTLALCALERLYEQLDTNVLREGWMRLQCEELVREEGGEVAHG